MKPIHRLRALARALRASRTPAPAPAPVSAPDEPTLQRYRLALQVIADTETKSPAARALVKYARDVLEGRA